ENPGKRIFLLSEMIHNPAVNDDLVRNGIRFIMDTEGNHYLPWEEITPDDVVIIPAFGTTVEIMEMLNARGVDLLTYNTTCPFVEKVWKRSGEIGRQGFSVLIHGKNKHEETRATFSHSYRHAPSLVLRDMSEAHMVGAMMRNEISVQAFLDAFAGKYSDGFDPQRDLIRVGVVNQTTMLAIETQAIADYFRQVMTELHGDDYKNYFADTRDTLCYATNDNQEAALALRDCRADLAMVIGGYNSSNTSQLVTILKEKMPTYFVRDEQEILDRDRLQHYDYHSRNLQSTSGWLPGSGPVKIALGSGASCPDSIVDAVIDKLLGFFEVTTTREEVLARLS
ncbi:MAG: 4-hydroxy-3-methylbut-2-enyl diphosphate reductase, partial [Flavobacteriales bacterium]|nr:4-hydroxy-3-methylbut-2-enyl diphosphate reductase [Flavobacteriales bacterium]